MQAAPTARSIDPTTTTMIMVTAVMLVVEGLEEGDDVSTMVGTTGLEVGDDVPKIVGTLIAVARNFSNLEIEIQKHPIVYLSNSYSKNREGTIIP
jgi:hypothetical protein